MAVESARRQTADPRSIHWRPDGLWQGYAGLTALFAAVDECRPGERWDVTGFEHLRVAARAAEGRRPLAPGLSAGLSGLAFVSWWLSYDGKRYRGLRSSIEASLIPLVASSATVLADGCPHGVGTAEFDVISGLAGAGRYLLLRGDDPCRSALESVLRSVVRLCDEEDGVPLWRTEPHFLADPGLQRQFPHGNLNCGLAHGIPGPLALLSLAAVRGVVVERQMDAIQRAADWLLRHQSDDEWGVNWPTVVPLDRGDRPTQPPGDGGPDGSANVTPSRSAWCYGSPGVARALWFAGQALEDRARRDVAIAAMDAAYRRPLSARRIDSPTVCHGVAGLQQITLRFANETGLPLFVDAARALHRQLMDAYEPASTLGFRNLEPGGTRTDQPGLLDGAAGVALVLLAASTPIEPRWDAVLLLS